MKHWNDKVKLRSLLFLWLVLFCLTGCDTGKTVYAPVTDLNLIESLPKSGVHRVQPGETLYSIAWRYGLDYRYLVECNHINSPYHVRTGQVIYLKRNKKSQSLKRTIDIPITSVSLRSSRTDVSHEENLNVGKKYRTKKVTDIDSERNQHPLSSAEISERSMKNNKTKLMNMEPKYKSANFERGEPQSKVKQWNWPARGAIVGYYTNRNKGLNIAGNIGEPIYATAAGRVVYSGNGLRRYGNMIIIKHNSNYLTAYAHNNRNLVKEGDWIQSKQKIAEMGDTGTDRSMLHFEIRKDGKPVNPLKFIRK